SDCRRRPTGKSSDGRSRALGRVPRVRTVPIIRTERTMGRALRWRNDWAHFLTGVVIGLLIVTPVLAMPPDLPVKFDDDARLLTLIGSGVLLFVAIMARALRLRDEATLDVPRSYGMRFFPSDRPMTLE